MTQCPCEAVAGPGIELSTTCIGHLWMFKDLKPAELEALAGGAARRQFRREESVFRQGDQANEMFLIKGGRLKLTKVLEDGTELTLDIRKAGDFVGENMLSEKADYPVSATCMEDSLTCGFSRSKFEQIVLAHPNIGLQIIRNMGERISLLTDRVGSMAVTSIEERLHRVLISVAREHGTHDPKGIAIRFPLTHEDLSFLIGAHRVSVTRAIKELKESGRIITEGKTLILPVEAA